MAKGGKSMVHAVLRGANGRRHDVAFEDTDITVEVYFGAEAVEIAVEAPDDPAPSERRRFALLNVPRELFKEALGNAARRSKNQRLAILEDGR
jgi:hypothetical protein